ncbi:glycoside hydrolase [Terrimonas sp.]|uniref:family 16 glycosylhydrolase n=1 Tax=Terrimonas sp. TaxID=1914338 RepID=UPI000D514DCC|nr:family 16 glycosylhydrolase [Terrimonas sp.]PVD50117.1 glycoside hydrolase [Terrimonas sp.]
MLKKECFSFLLVVCFAMNISCKKGGNEPPPVVPVVKVEDALQLRTTSDAVLYFVITLNKTTTVPVSVDYTLVDGSASAPGDYIKKSGTITIPANNAQVQLDVAIKGDPEDNRENNLDFTLQLSNPENCTLGVTSAMGTIITENGKNLTTDNTGYTTPLTYAGYTLAWSDEFSGEMLDAAAWNYEVGNGSGGWGNNELEYYTNSNKNVFLSNGNLIIEARKESVTGFNYSSARITTQNKKTFTHGRIDIRAKLPVAKGIWPALWMLGDNISTVGWPACGEIDIMELVGQNPSTTYGTAHWQNALAAHNSKNAGYNLTSGNFSQQFHVFSLVWTGNSMQWYVDDNLFLTTTKAEVGDAVYPFNKPQFFIFNVAVGGDWPGAPDGTTQFPQRMFVDYVRVFQ